MTSKKIVIVEDEQDIVELVTFTLTREGFEVISVTDFHHVLPVILDTGPDLVILDLMLPGQSGYDLCKLIKQNPKTAAIPVMILSARSEDSDIVLGLEIGSDDFVTKPFSPKVLVARVRTLLRRGVVSSEVSSGLITLGDLVINENAHSVTLSGEPITLTHSEFKILHFLAQKPGWVFSRYQLADAIRPGEYAIIDRSMDVLIVGLRRKLKTAGQLIETVRGIGYRIKHV